MHIRQLRIQNLACFDDVSLDFTDDDDDKPCRWVVLLGENGTGKTTALQALMTALPTRLTGLSSERYVPWLRPAGSCRVSAAVEYHHGDMRSDARNRDDFTFEMPHDTEQPLRRDGAALPAPGVLNIQAGCFIAGYRPWSRSGRRLAVDADSTSFAWPGGRSHRITSLFDNYDSLTPIREWLSDLDFRRLKEKIGNERDRAEFTYDLAVRAIESVFPNGSARIVEVTPTKDVTVEEHGVRVSIESLSDGYRSAMNWIGDLVRRLVEAFPKMENPLHAYGVVLVDEIDLHLHPSWQRTVIDQIRKVFPNLQFIVTTHSPFIAQEMTEKDKIIVLKRGGDHVTATEDKGFVQGWRVDQILTSPLFGLRETRGRLVAEAQNIQRELLDRRAQKGISSADKAKLAEVQDLIARMKSPPDDHITANGNVDVELRRAANQLLDIISKRTAELAKKK